MITTKVKTLVLIGESTDYYEDYFRGTAKIVKADSMRSAVNMAFDEADKGDIVLLSPACASFDMYNNYMERGDDYKQNVNRLIIT